MTAARKIERPKSLTELAVERIRHAIVGGRLQLGAQISEAALALELGISKTPVREALLQLRAEGLVDVHPQRGTFVFLAEPGEVAQICRFREIIETAALVDAMAADTAGLVAELDANLRCPTSERALPDLDAEFHAIVVRRSNNGYLRDAYRLVEHKVHALRWRLPPHNDQIAGCQDKHALIVERIRAGAATQAQSLLRDHIRATEVAYEQAAGLGASGTP